MAASARLGVCMPLSITATPLPARPSCQATAFAASSSNSSKWVSCMTSPVQNTSPSCSRFIRRSSTGSMPSRSASTSISRSEAQTDCIAPYPR